MTHTTYQYSQYYVTHCSLGCSTLAASSLIIKDKQFYRPSPTMDVYLDNAIGQKYQMIKPDRSLVFHRTLFSAPIRKKHEKVPRSLCTEFIFKLVIVLAHCSLGHNHRSRYVHSVCAVALAHQSNSLQLSLRIMTPDFSRACHITLTRVFLQGYMKLDTLSIQCPYNKLCA